MDKATDRKEKVKEINSENLGQIEMQTNPSRRNEIACLLDSLDASRASALKLLDVQSGPILSRPIFSNKLTVLHIKYLMNLGHEMAHWTIVSAFAIERAQERLVNLEKIIDEITRKLNIDLPNVKAEMESLKKTLNSEEVSAVSSIIKKITKTTEDYEKKMKENDLAE